MDSEKKQNEACLVKPLGGFIYRIRNKIVVIDHDLSDLYGVKTGRLNAHAKRSNKYSTDESCFQLNDNEYSELVAKCDRLRNLKHSSSNPYAYTVSGILILSSMSGIDLKETLRIINTMTVISEKSERQRKIDALNHKYWKEMTILSSESYCCEMLWLSAYYQKILQDDPDLDSFKEVLRKYLAKVIDYNKLGVLGQKLDELEKESPFPDDLKGYLHEYHNHGKDRIFQPMHIMCKLATLRDDENETTYEFLIEYGLLESDVEIYYGIKAISDNPETTEEFAFRNHLQSKKWMKYLGDKTKKTGSTAGLNKGHKFTNNVNDGTFWISWVRKESDASLHHVLNRLEKIYNNFKDFSKLVETTTTNGFSTAHFILDSESRRDEKENNDLKDNSNNDNIIKILNKACEFKVLIPKNGRYEFITNNQKEVRLFLELLFNRDNFKEKIKKAKEIIWDQMKSDNKDINRHIGTYQKEIKTIPNQSAKDWLWIQETFRLSGGVPLNDSFKKSSYDLTKKSQYEKAIKLLGLIEK